MQDSRRFRRDLSRPAVTHLLVTRDCNFTVQISLARIDSNVNPCMTICDEWALTVHIKMLNELELSVGMDFHLVLQKSKKRKRSVKKTFNFMPCERRFLSCMAFSVYEVVLVACLSRSWLRDRQVTRATSWEPSARRVSVSALRGRRCKKD